ncbi:MAG: hypothetical protein EBU84_18230, partial [Actinobacteria bacterium]|nr:hypothetical protein [Actinomycetota bacterium]
ASYTTTGNITLYARWQATITFDGNGGSGAASPSTQTSATANYTLSTQGTLSKTPQTFAGWGSNATGTGNNLGAGVSVVNAGNTTWYALWNSTPNIPDLDASSDTGTSSTDNNTSDQTPTFTVTGLTINALVTVEFRYLSGNQLAGSCSFTATSSTGSCTIASALSSGNAIPSNTYYAIARQRFGTSTTDSALSSTITIDATAPTPQITVSSGTSTNLTTNQTGQVTSTELGSVYLVRNSLSVIDEASITSSSANLWKKITISNASQNTLATLSGLLGGTYRAYAFDQHGNMGGPSTNSMNIFSQPGAATALIATPGVGTMGPKIDLSWTAPVDNGGGINYHNVEYSTDGGTTWLAFPNKASSSSPFSVYPVNYETDYIFRITPVNLWGVGTASNNSNSANVAIPACSPAMSPNGKTHIFPIGACTWTVPSGVTSINIDARGGQGGWGVYGYSNGGGQLTGTLTVTPGETLYLYVGDQGTTPAEVFNSIAGRPGFNGGGWGGSTTSTASTSSAVTGGGGGG